MNRSARFLSAAVCAFMLYSVHAEQEEVGPVKRGLVLHYTFDQVRGGQVDSVQGEEHAGMGEEASFIPVEGSGMALSLQQNSIPSGYVETPDHEDLNPQIFTVAAWIKLGKTNKNGSVVCKHDWQDGGARGYVLRCYTEQRLNFTVGAGGWIAAVGATTIPAYAWTHVAGAFDGTNITVYVNGRLDGRKQIQKPYETSSYPLRIGHGAFKLDTHRKFDGEIDDVMIWKRVLSEQEIRTVYDDQKGSKPEPLTAEAIAHLVEQLGADKFKKRIKAQKELMAIGSETLPLLEPHRKTEDPEIRLRLKKAEKAIREEAGK
ncbi:MAG: hypothetical protein ACI97B_004653 [Verrucomicrobiales bacterium]|jgi:hypothetical protein